MLITVIVRWQAMTRAARLKEVTGIKDIFSVILDIADNQKKFSKDEESVPSPGSVADELTKLANLKAQGILSEEEFEKQKAKLLG